MPPPITADSTFLEALRVRPLLAHEVPGLKSDFWEHPRAPLREFFPGHADRLETLLLEALAWAVPAAGSDWGGLSAAHLLDHLAHNHREFFGVLLADAQRLFDARLEESGGPGDGGEIAILREALGRFSAELRARVEEDERDLFPRVLRYEASLRDPRVDPEFNGGSLRKAVAYRASRERTDPVAALESLASRLGASGPARAGDPWLSLLGDRLGELRDRLADHERLMAEVLYPMALEAEKRLYNRSIGGARRQTVAIA